ncbi:MAG: DUF4252 domain-containing protein [Flavobacteriaceae bacterium]
MNISSIKNIVLSLFIVVALTSCNYGETLQSYFVANQEAPNFVSIDIPISFVSVENIELTADQKEAYESIDKLNMLGYTLNDNNEEEYKAELTKVQTLLKDEKYQELFRGGNSTDGKVVVKYIGDDESIDELIVLGSANGRGFAVIRVLGDNMKPSKIMQLGDVVGKMSSDENAVQDFMKFFQFK